LLIRHLDPILRRSARLSDWQVINPNDVTGEVAVVESLRAVQGRRFERPTVIVAEKVFGDEEPPEGVRAVITPSSVDLVSHVAVRARNAQLLFATCYDRECFDRLQAMKGRRVRLEVNAAGDVLFGEAAEASATVERAGAAPVPRRVPPPRPLVRPLRRQEFEPDLVGGKSCHLKELAKKLPDWIQVPRSVALPFAVFDAVLALDANRAVAERYRGLLAQIESNPSPALAEMRQLVLVLQLPESLPADLRQVMQAENLPWPEDWPAAAGRIKQVWASKWNDRAWFSRQARGFPHQSMFIAVLIQEVVEAEYAFVIHTANPLTGNRAELYAEVVPGLGETLVGNYPGRAMSFVSPKAAPAAAVLAYPSKSAGLYGGGLIFRSDSNAEDLDGYAGAGLYDSVLLAPPREWILDYTNDALVWDPKFRAEFLASVTRLGTAVEQAMGAPQDVEGAWSQGRFFVVQTRPQVGLKP
jgi:alpha-glucan,water dikinase